MLISHRFILCIFCILSGTLSTSLPLGSRFSGSPGTTSPSSSPSSPSSPPYSCSSCHSSLYSHSSRFTFWSWCSHSRKVESSNFSILFQHTYCPYSCIPTPVVYIYILIYLLSNLYLLLLSIYLFILQELPAEVWGGVRRSADLLHLQAPVSRHRILGSLLQEAEGNHAEVTSLKFLCRCGDDRVTWQQSLITPLPLLSLVARLSNWWMDWPVYTPGCIWLEPGSPLPAKGINTLSNKNIFSFSGLTNYAKDSRSIIL